MRFFRLKGLPQLTASYFQDNLLQTSVALYEVNFANLHHILPEWLPQALYVGQFILI